MSMNKTKHRLPPLADRSYNAQLRYTLDRDERVGRALLDAFRRDGIEPEDRDTFLYDWIDVEAVDRLHRRHDPNLRVSARVWDHAVVITHDEITLYAPRSE